MNYLYPPRPQNAVSVDHLHDFKPEDYIAQSKLNGSCMMLFLNSEETVLMNRHKEMYSKPTPFLGELQSLNKGDEWMVLVGEYMDKAKKNKEGKLFNHNLVLFDIVVHNNVILDGKTNEERQTLLDSLFPSENYDGYINKLVGYDTIYKVKNFSDNFRTLYDQMCEIDMYEGLVLKKKDYGLSSLKSENNNPGSQVKFRKSHKNYVY